MIPEKFKIPIAYAIICLLWGSTWLAIKVGVEELSPAFSAGIRFLIAAVLIYLIAKYRRLKISYDAESMKLYLILAFFSFSIPFGLVYWAEQFVPSGLASILFGIFPFFVIFFSTIIIPDQKPNVMQVIGAVLGFAGIFVIFSEQLIINLDLDLYFWGMIAIAFSAAMQGWVAVHIKKHSLKINPLTMNFLPLLIAGTVMTLIGLIFEWDYDWNFSGKAISSVAYLAVFGTIGTFTTYYWLMKRINVVLLSLSSFITPIVAVLLGFFILDEVLTSRDFLGSVFVLIGILLANLKGLLKYLKEKRK